MAAAQTATGTSLQDPKMIWDSELWEGIEPCPQNDGVAPVVPIAYTEDCGLKRT